MQKSQNIKCSGDPAGDNFLGWFRCCTTPVLGGRMKIHDLYLDYAVYDQAKPLYSQSVFSEMLQDSGFLLEEINGVQWVAGIILTICATAKERRYAKTN